MIIKESLAKFYSSAGLPVVKIIVAGYDGCRSYIRVAGQIQVDVFVSTLQKRFQTKSDPRPHAGAIVLAATAEALKHHGARFDLYTCVHARQKSRLL